MTALFHAIKGETKAIQAEVTALNGEITSLKAKQQVVQRRPIRRPYTRPIPVPHTIEVVVTPQRAPKISV